MRNVIGLVIFVALVCSGFQSKFSDLHSIRLHFYSYPSNKSLCKSAIEEFESKQNLSNTYLGYLGYLQTVWANHTFNPVNKFSTFNKGKKNIEKAIKKNPNDIEIRLIRLAVQKNAPSFLGYNDNINEDSEFLKNNRNQIKSEVLLKNIETILKQ